MQQQLRKLRESGERARSALSIVLFTLSCNKVYPFFIMPSRRRKQQQQQLHQLSQWETIFWLRTSIVAGCMLLLWCGLLAFERFSCPDLTCWRMHSSLAAASDADGARRRTSNLVVSVTTTAANNHHPLLHLAAKPNALRKIQQPFQLDAQAELIDDKSSLKQPTRTRTQKLSDEENATTDTASNEVDSQTLPQALARKQEKQLPLDEKGTLVSKSSTETQRLRDEENETVEQNILHNEEEWFTRELDHELLLHQHQQVAVTTSHPAGNLDLQQQQRSQSLDQSDSFLTAGQPNVVEPNENAEPSVLHKEEEWLAQELDHELLLLQPQQQQQEASIESGSSSTLARDIAVELETLRKEEEWVASELEADTVLQQPQTEENRLISSDLLNRMELDILRKEEEWAAREIQRFHRAQGTLPVRYQDEQDIAATTKALPKLPHDFMIDASHLQTKMTAAASTPMATERR